VAALRPERFKDVFSASTMVEVKGLVNEDLMLEIEAVAVLEE
jgi:enamine deaminase RidA (YjgF/YER057c/UK114 family)